MNESILVILVFALVVWFLLSVLWHIAYTNKTYPWYAWIFAPPVLIVSTVVDWCARWYRKINKAIKTSSLKDNMQTKHPEMKPCPFCGHAVDMDDPDTLYPSGVGWKIREGGYRSYHNFREVPPEQWCYSIHCVTTSGGCDAEIGGDSRQECIDKWNRRV